MLKFSPATLRQNLRAFLFAALLFCLYSSCQNGQPENGASSQTEQTPLPSYEELATYNVAARLNQQGDSAMDASDYPAAIAFYQQSVDSAAVQGDSFLYYDSKLDLAFVHDRLGESKTAVEMAKPVLDAFIRSGDSTRIGRAYVSLGGLYGRAGMPEKGIETVRKGFEILKQDTSLMHRCAAYNQMAFTYSDFGDWKAALPLLDTALQYMEASRILDQHPGMLLNIGNCRRKLGQWAEARRYFEAAATEADSLGQAHIYAKALDRLSQVAEASGDPATALRLFRQSRDIMDSIFTEDKSRHIQTLEVEHQTHEKEQEIKILHAQHETQAARRNLLAAGLVFLLALLAFIWYSLRIKLKLARLALVQHQRDLQEYAQLLLTKNARLQELESALAPNRANAQPAPPQTPDAQPTAADSDESLFNSRILTDDDWEGFKARFERLYPGYLLRLRSSFPEITGAEERLFLLLKLNLNNHEVAGILGITPNGVKKGRQRLRRRLGLMPDEELETVIQAF